MMGRILAITGWIWNKKPSVKGIKCTSISAQEILQVLYYCTGKIVIVHTDTCSARQQFYFQYSFQFFKSSCLIQTNGDSYWFFLRDSRTSVEPYYTCSSTLFSLIFHSFSFMASYKLFRWNKGMLQQGYLT